MIEAPMVGPWEGDHKIARLLNKTTARRISLHKSKQYNCSSQAKTIRASKYMKVVADKNM
jgi:hypothetical protein